ALSERECKPSSRLARCGPGYPGRGRSLGVLAARRHPPARGRSPARCSGDRRDEDQLGELRGDAGGARAWRPLDALPTHRLDQGRGPRREPSGGEEGERLVVELDLLADPGHEDLAGPGPAELERVVGVDAPARPRDGVAVRAGGRIAEQGDELLL